jgi:hypothetical protein
VRQRIIWRFWREVDTGGEFVFRHLSPLDSVGLPLVSALKGEFATSIEVGEGVDGGEKIAMNENNSRCSYNQEGAGLNITNFDTGGEFIQPGWGSCMSRSKWDFRVNARGVPINHSPRRTRFSATAISTCCKCVLAIPL